MATVNIPVPPDKQRHVDTESNALLQVLMSATPDQIRAYMVANATTIPQIQKILEALAMATRFLYHRSK